MTFNESQTRALKAKLRHQHVKRRITGATSIAYVEGWHAIAEANRIFGFDCWDRQTLSPNCVWSTQESAQTSCVYSTKVRITVRSEGSVTVREGIGTGFGRAQRAEEAHEIALKAAETDATKRALATFGNPFGLALYDRGLQQVTKPRSIPKAEGVPRQAAFVLKVPGAEDQELETAPDFVDQALKAVSNLTTVESIFAFWSANIASFSRLELQEIEREKGAASIEDLFEEIRKRIHGFADQGSQAGIDAGHRRTSGVSLRGAESGQGTAFLIPKEKRIRDKAHLAFVASQPCIVCGRRPAQAHHLRFAQQRAMGLKVSDEFTLPLCNVHHDSVHRTGDERAWWARSGIIEPLKYAERLWVASHPRSQATVESERKTPNETTVEGRRTNLVVQSGDGVVTSEERSRST